MPIVYRQMSRAAHRIAAACAALLVATSTASAQSFLPPLSSPDTRPVSNAGPDVRTDKPSGVAGPASDPFLAPANPSHPLAEGAASGPPSAGSTQTPAAAPTAVRGIENPVNKTPLADQQLREKELRFERLRKQIQDLINARNQAPPFPSPSTAPPHSPDRQLDDATNRNVTDPSFSTSSDPISVPVPLFDDDPFTPQPLIPSTPKVSAEGSPPDTPPADSVPAEPIASPDSPVPAMPPAQPITAVDEPIDRLGLADSLYAAGELMLARDAYLHIDRSELTAADSYWIDYQLAACHRRLGERSEAGELYRKLAGDPQAGWLTPMATWWLERIEERAALQMQADQFAQLLKDLTSQIDGAHYDDTSR